MPKDLKAKIKDCAALFAIAVFIVLLLGGWKPILYGDWRCLIAECRLMKN